VVSPTAKRRAIQHTVSEGLGTIRQGCRAMRLRASSFYKAPTLSRSRQLMREATRKMSLKYPCYGYRRITVMLQREGWDAGVDMVQRYRRKHGLQVRRKQRKMKRLGISTSERRQAEYPRHVWSWDIIQDRTESGSALKMLTIIDEYTKESLKIWPAWGIRADDVIEQLEEVMKEYGVPEHLRSDNGSEFIAYAVQDWLKNKNIQTIYIKPGSPWENAYIESFHDKMRTEFLNREIFTNILEARVLCEQFRSEYNNQRPHSSLDYQTPAEFAAIFPSPMGEGRGMYSNINNQAELYIQGVH
jgi:putative transposase